MSISFAIVAWPGAQEAAVLGLRDLLVEAARHRPEGLGDVEVDVVRPPDLPTRSYSAVVLPPRVGSEAPGPPGEALAAWLLSLHRSGTTLCSVCVGAFLLAELGVLDGRPATTHWALADVFRARFPAVRLKVDRMVVDDGDVVTAGGVMAWVDLGLALVARWMGPTTALSTARILLVDTGGREQSFYATFAPVWTHGDDAILSTQRWLQSRIGMPVSVDEMAARVGHSRRTFQRRFRKATGMSVSAYLQELRVHRARELLERTSKDVEQVAHEVGYEEAGSLRRVFVERIGTTPRDYRRRLGLG